MKRFYCTICGRIKRTQKWPNILEQMDAAYPENRLGECNWHNDRMVPRKPFKLDKTYRKPVVIKVAPVVKSRKRA